MREETCKGEPEMKDRKVVVVGVVVYFYWENDGYGYPQSQSIHAGHEFFERMNQF